MKVTSARSRGFYGGQESHGSCSSRKLWPECLMLPGLGEGCEGGMRWGLRMALMADLGPQGEVRMGCFLHTKHMYSALGTQGGGARCELGIYWRRNPCSLHNFSPRRPHMPCIPHSVRPSLSRIPLTSRFFPRDWEAGEGCQQDPSLLDRGRES